jgi:DNA-nicking Smr family endonuclease
MARKRGGGEDAGQNGPSEAAAPVLSPEDRDLWKHVTRDTSPLAKREPPTRPEPAQSAAAKPETAPAPETALAAKTKTKKTSPARTPVRVPPPEPPKPAAPKLAHGTIAGVDKRSAARLRRGKLPVEARLDLHGYSQAEAHRELDAFLAGAQAAGKRCVLIITGKGTTKETGGVLRAQVPNWLNQPPNRDRILAFDHAQSKDGGLGALYVLLRRRRDG